ncbi:MAG: hypothetical protein JSW21_09160 [Gammaproteobacteria bacterium]|nr:MAG: hypothetical protein JSW21_09160 [Gammaproteobacteria bacterium]
MSRHRMLTESPRRRRAVLAVAFMLLGFQLVGGSLHASAHEPTSDCQVCVALDRLDPALIPFVGSDVGSAADVVEATYDYPLLALSASRAYAIRAPPASRRS